MIIYYQLFKLLSRINAEPIALISGICCAISFHSGKMKNHYLKKEPEEE